MPGLHPDPYSSKFPARERELVEQVRSALTEERAGCAASGKQHELGCVCGADADVPRQSGRKMAADALEDRLLVAAPFQQAGQRRFGR